MRCLPPSGKSPQVYAVLMSMGINPKRTPNPTTMTFSIRTLALFILLACITFHANASDELARAFAEPPADTRPRCYWYWMDGHISREGLTKDLEAMKRVGIGGAYIGVISGQSGSRPNPEPKALTPEWWAFIEHAIREASRIDIQIGLFNSPGWSQSGGPWVTPDKAMRYIVQTEIPVKGPQTFAAKLPAPQDGFQPLTVQAFPAPAGESAIATVLSRTADTIVFKMPENTSARSLTVRPSEKINAPAELQASADGTNFRTIRKFEIARYNVKLGVGPVPLAPVVISFPAVADRHFRLVCAAAAALGDVQLSAAARVDSLAEKSLLKMFQWHLPPFDFYSWPPAPEPESTELSIRPETVVDLTQYLRPDGTLAWDIPPGDWIILRSGLVPTGTTNTPAPAEATGLEVDKMNRAALKTHFDAFITPLLKKLTPAERKSWTHVIADSYETGPQNWTDGVAADFQKRYGYDPLRFLPVMGGRIVGSADRSDRFLWDLRRFVADRIASEYVGGLRELCHEAGLKLWLENYGHWGFPAEFLQYGGQSDEVGGEFWMKDDFEGVELRDAASAAHTYGKPVVWAEAFTGGPAFVSTPRNLKARGDWAFTHGINQFVLHVYIHQPWEDKKPGINAWFGTEFNRHNTWFDSSKPWIDYLRRCSVMLQAGKPVADVVYFIGEDTPKMAGQTKPELPKGHDYDFINAEVIMNRLSVSNGRFILPDGMSYRLLVIPPSQTMRPPVLRKIQQLVADGGAVLGPLPERSPSMENHPACDEEVKTIAASLRAEGKMMPDDIAQAFERLAITPDVIAPPDILWKHRQTADSDVYFLTNQSPQPRRETFSFRVSGKGAELWWPDTGKIEQAVPCIEAAGRSNLTLKLDASASVFVVFRGQPNTAALASPVSSSKQKLVIHRASYEAIDGAGGADVTALLSSAIVDGQLDFPVTFTALGGDPAYRHVKQLIVDYSVDGVAATISLPENAWLRLHPGTAIEGPWQVQFPSKSHTFEKLIPWSEHTDPDIRYFSGTAVYSKRIDLADAKGGAMIDLGTVNSIAKVRVNGKLIGTLWKEPYLIEIGNALRIGTNLLEVEVMDTWNNRLVGDRQPGAKPTTFTTHRKIKASTGLQPSGLLGPVRLVRPD